MSEFVHVSKEQTDLFFFTKLFLIPTSYLNTGCSFRHRRSENSPATMQNSPAKFHSFPKRASLFDNNSPVTLHCSPATTLNL